MPSPRPLERIALSAIKQDGETFTGRKYHDVIAKIYKETGKAPTGEPGFETDTGRFVDKREAAQIAYRAGQTIEKLERLDDIDDLYQP